MNNKLLEKYQNSSKLPLTIKDKIKDVLNEEDAYAADELVSLSEEILFQIAAIGISTYLSQPLQKQVYNDFILQLFTSKSHAYNAGPLYRWAANMIKSLDDKTAQKISPLFWKKGILNEDINKLSKLRNAVMHGFFILPASRNHKEAEHIANVLTKIIDLDLFSVNKEALYHFLSKEDDIVFFNEDWSIEENQWQLFDKSYSFGELTQDIQYELSEKYNEDQQVLVRDNINKDKVIESVTEFINSNSRGSMAVFSRPSQSSLSDYANLVNYLDQDKYLKLFYSLDSHGVNVTDDFLLTRLVKKLANDTKTEKYSKDPAKAVVQLSKKCSKQIIIILNDIHISLFNPNHILHLKDLFHQNKILFVAFGHDYPWMSQFFNSTFYVSSESYLPKKNEWEDSFNNYLRFKGPNKDIENENESYLKLYGITSKLLSEFKKDKLVVARRFADKYKYSIEFVHEAFSVLHPFLNAENMPFELDELDPLYDFPKELTESSQVFFTIGRRDAKLEYKHKALKL